MIREMLAALKAQHHALDCMLAEKVRADSSFLPSKSAAWPALKQGWAAIQKAEAADASNPT